MKLTHALALSANPESFLFMEEKAPTSVHSVRLELPKLVLIGIRTTYLATGVCAMVVIEQKYY